MAVLIAACSKGQATPPPTPRDAPAQHPHQEASTKAVTHFVGERLVSCTTAAVVIQYPGAVPDGTRLPLDQAVLLLLDAALTAFAGGDTTLTDTETVDGLVHFAVPMQNRDEETQNAIVQIGDQTKDWPHKYHRPEWLFADQCTGREAIGSCSVEHEHSYRSATIHWFAQQNFYGARSDDATMKLCLTVGGKWSND